MRYVQLRAFHFVCLSGGFSKAAEALCLTQPAISDQVRKLEEEYDILLFSRTSKNVVPTAAGLGLLEITRRFFDASNEAQDYLNDRRAVSHGSLRIVADSAMHLIDILPLFRSQHPNVSIQIQTGNSDTVMQRLKNYEADAGVLGIALSGSEFDTISLRASRLIAFVGQSHPLAHTKSISLNKLLKQSLVLREHGSRTRSSVEKIATERSLKLNATIEAHGREAVHEIVAAGTGVGIVSEAELARDPRLVPLPISDCKIQMQESLICLRERSQSRNIKAFFASAKDHLIRNENL